MVYDVCGNCFSLRMAHQSQESSFIMFLIWILVCEYVLLTWYLTTAEISYFDVFLRNFVLYDFRLYVKDFSIVSDVWYFGCIRCLVHCISYAIQDLVQLFQKGYMQIWSLLMSNHCFSPLFYYFCELLIFGFAVNSDDHWFC